jgi:hypothetical protein
MINLSLQYILKYELPYCEPTTEDIDTNIDCENHELESCISFRNTLASLSHLHNQYSYVYPMDWKVVFSSNGRLLKTKCKNIDKIEQIEDPNACYNDIKVKAEILGNIKEVFPTRDLINMIVFIVLFIVVLIKNYNKIKSSIKCLRLEDWMIVLAF